MSLTQNYTENQDKIKQYIKQIMDLDISILNQT